MVKQDRKYLIIIMVISIIILAVFFLTRGGKEENNNTEENTQNQVVEEYVKVLEDGTKLNTSTELNKTKTVGSYKFENIQLTNRDGKSVLLADVTNTSNKQTELQLVDVEILDKSGNKLGKVSGIIAPLKAGESIQFNTAMSLDYANAYDFKIILK